MRHCAGRPRTGPEAWRRWRFYLPGCFLAFWGALGVGTTESWPPSAGAAQPSTALTSAQQAASMDGMILIPAGAFVMGSTGKEGKVGFDIGVDELPQHEVYLDSYHIDQFELTNLQYGRFIKATGRPAPGDPKDPEYYTWADNEVPKGHERYPVVYVTWYDAEAYCQWAGKRLPTEEEWEKAARGTEGRAWPWGNQFDPSRCNVLETELGWLAQVGSFPQGVSPYGVHDLCGNVAEWTSSWYKAYPGNTLKRASFGEQYKVCRGGAWAAPAGPYARATNRNLAQPLDYRHRTVGFRCAMDPQ